MNRLLTQKEQIKNKIAKKFNLNPKKEFILYGGTNYGDQVRKKMFNSILKAMESLPNHELIIKLHPNESPDLIHNLMKLHGKSYPVVKYYNIYELMVASEFYISRSSGSEFEAMLMDRDVIDINYEINDDLYRYIEYGAAKRVLEPKELLNILKKVINDKNTHNELKKGREKYISSYLYKFDGKASERIYDLIQKIVNESTNQE